MSTYRYWRSALALVGDCGKLSREQMAEIGPVHENAPQFGFFRWPHKSGRTVERWAPVAIWADPEDGSVQATVDNEDTDPCEAWVWCCRYPITEQTYRSMTEPVLHEEDA